MSSVHDGLGAALKNQAGEVLEVTDAIGPVTLVVHNVGTYPVVVSVFDKETGALVTTDKDTAVTGEDTGYDGDTATTDFSGQALNNVPVLPGSVVVKPTAGGNSVDAKDTNGDGKLYTDDVDADYCGTIDYDTGDLTLFYPTGKEPNTTNILADYAHADETQVAGGKRSLLVGNNPPSKDLVVKAAGLGGYSQVRVDALVSF